MPVPLFRTPVSLPPKSVAIAPNTGLLFVGSCFAAEVGERALSAGLKAVVNPAGTLYNMESIWVRFSAGAIAATIVKTIFMRVLIACGIVVYTAVFAMA